MENPHTQASTIEDRLDLLVQQGGGHDRALELLVDILAERGRRLADARREDCVDLIMAVAPACQSRSIGAATQRLATLDQAPRTLILALAQLAIDIEAAQQAERARNSGPDRIEDDLTRMIDAAAREQLVTLASRDDLHPSACAKIMDRGDIAAIATCARNRKARFDRAGFIEIASLAADDAQIRSALCHRWDIPEDDLGIFWDACIDQDKARLLVAGFSAESEPEVEASAALLTPEEDEALESERQLADLILEHTKPTSLPRAAQRLAEQAGIDEGLAFDLICGSYERGMVLLARAANMDEWAFLKLVCSRLKQISGMTTPHRALKNFRACSREEARKILASVDNVKALVAQEKAAAKVAAKAAARNARGLRGQAERLSA